MSEESHSEQLVHIESRVGTLTAILHRPAPAAAATRPPCVVASHGLYSDRESQKLADLGRSLTRRGVAFLRYDCMGCGDSGGAFAETTLASRVADLTEVLAWVRQEDLAAGGIGLMGSSMGGFASLCLAAADPGIAATAVWAAPASFEDLHDEDRERGGAPDAEATELDAEPEGWIPPVLGPEFYRTLHTPDLVGLASSLTNVFFLHGEDDETVPLSHALRLYRLAGEPKRIEIFPGGDHRFSDPAARERAVALSTEWLVQGLLG